MLSRIETGFSRYKNNALLSLGEKVVGNISANSSLFSKDVLEQKDKLDVMCKKFINLINMASTHATPDIDRRNDYRVEFIHQLNVLASMLNLTYKGNSAILDSTGFVVIKQKKNLTLTQITEVKLSQSTQQSYIDVRMIGGDNYKSVDVLYTTQKDLEEDKWDRKMITKKTTELGEFPAATLLYVQLIAYGKDNTKVRSIINSIGVQ